MKHQDITAPASNPLHAKPRPRAIPAPAVPTLVLRWHGRERVVVLAYASRPALRNACARLSSFLEDAAWAGSVMPDVPTSDAACAAARYAGHNFTDADVVRFAHAAAGAGAALDSAEVALVDLAHRLRGDGGDNVALVAVAGVGLSADELRATLVHEAMHGVFETEECVRSFVDDFWSNVMTERGRDVWRGWLHGLGYNTRADDRLAKNELLAYLCTEPRGKPLWLLGSARKACAMGEPLFDGDVGGGTDGEALSRLRDVFVARAEVAVPPPHPVAGAGHRARCVWDVARYVFSQQARERCHAALRTSCSILSIERADRCARPIKTQTLRAFFGRVHLRLGGLARCGWPTRGADPRPRPPAPSPRQVPVSGRRSVLASLASAGARVPASVTPFVHASLPPFARASRRRVRSPLAPRPPPGAPGGWPGEGGVSGAPPACQ